LTENHHNLLAIRELTLRPGNSDLLPSQTLPQGRA